MKTHATLALIWMLGQAAVFAEEQRPNVLVILLDDAGYHDFGFMGSREIETPNIDRLAESGIVCSDAHLSGTTCSPSRASLMTGRYQQRFGHHNNVPPHGKGMDPSEKTIGDTMKSAGYKTYYVGKWHLGNPGPYHPTRRGFDEFHGLLEGSRSYFPNGSDDKPGDTKSIEYNGRTVEWQGYLTDHFTDAAITFLRQPREQPFFMVLGYTAPHTPMQAKPDDLKRFEGHPRQKLAAMLWAADRGVGRVLDTLEELKLRENTLIFFLSDNGGPLENNSDNTPLKGVKGTKFEGGHRTPFIVSWPNRLKPGTRFGGLVSAMDIHPTAAAAADTPVSHGEPLDGVNLLPYLTNEKEGDPHDILFWHRDSENAARSGDFKLIGHDKVGWRLYNLVDDIGETHDLSKEDPDTVRRLRKALDAWRAELTEPQWDESKQWADVKFEFYRAWLDNEQPRYTNPRQLESWRRKNPGSR